MASPAELRCGARYQQSLRIRPPRCKPKRCNLTFEGRRRLLFDYGLGYEDS